MCLASVGAELVDEGEDVAVILRQQLAQVRRPRCPDALLGDNARPLELFVDLLVQVLAVSHDHERPVPGHFPKHLLGEEEHRHRLPRALRVPEHAELSALLRRRAPQFLHPGDGVVNAEVLVVAC